MGKKVTYVSTKTDPSVQWYYQTAAAAGSTPWNNRLAFMVANPTITPDITVTDTNLTSIITFADDSIYEEFANLTQAIIPEVMEYCTQHNITYDITVEDI